MPENSKYSKEKNAYRRRIIENNSNFRETRRSPVVVIEFPEWQHNFQRHTIVLVEQSYSGATNPRIYNSNNIIAFSNSIASFKRNIRSNFSNQLKEVRTRFKYFPWSHFKWSLVLYQFSQKNNSRRNKRLIEQHHRYRRLLQNILKIAARYKTFGTSVLQTCKVSRDMVANMNLVEQSWTIIYEWNFCIKMSYIYYIHR